MNEVSRASNDLIALRRHMRLMKVVQSAVCHRLYYHTDFWISGYYGWSVHRLILRSSSRFEAIAYVACMSRL